MASLASPGPDRRTILQDNPHRLPRTAVPSRYELEFEPDLANGTFDGRGRVAVTLTQRVEHLVLNSLELDIARAELESPGGQLPLTVERDDDAERVTLRLPTAAEPGEYHLDLAWTGSLDGPLEGFYRSTFKDFDGVEQTIASTQFEATAARRAFPCWDEPDLKSVFSVTLVVPEDLMTVSNTSEISREPTGSGKVRVRFADTMKMSTYLVAFVVGPLEATESVDVDGVPVRVIAPRGKLHLTRYALGCAVFTLRYLRDYYTIPYPGDKLDHVAVPDFGFGAMENLGCVIYREAALLLDEATASQQEKLRVLDVIGHETAHMWFGDLVTMKWWDGIWLNEAFATFMEMKATDSHRPDWRRWLTFGAVERPWAYGIDGLASTRPVEFEVGSPTEANEMFDALTYGKGSALLRMIEQYIGEEAFRRGVGDYLRAHEYANSVTSDLWKGLDGASGLPVGDIMDSWILQPGFPQLEVDPSGSSIRLRQRRFLTIPDETDQTRWQIPVQLRGATGEGPFERRLIMAEDENEIAVGGPPLWVNGNAGGHGFYRTLYRPEDRTRLVARLPELASLERFVLIDDAWAFVESGQATVADYLELAAAYRDEPEQAVWQAILGGLGAIRHHVVRPDDLGGYRKLVNRLIGPVQERLGFEAAPADDDLTRRLRGQLIAARGRIAAHPPTIEFCRQLAPRAIADPDAVDPDIARASLFVLAANGGEDEYELLDDARHRAPDPQMELRYLQALASFEEPSLAVATVGRALDGTLRKQDSAWVIGTTLAGEAGPAAWEEARHRWEEVAAVPPSTHRRVVEGLAGLSQPAVAVDVLAFFAETPVPAAAKLLSQSLERLRAYVALREREGKALGRYLGGVLS